MTVPSFMMVDPARSEPIYQQIADAVAREIAAGSLTSGDALPPVREVAVMLRVNLNTVSKAYQRLQMLGLAEIRKGLGVYVAGGNGAVSRRVRMEMLESRFDALIKEARQLGLSEEEILEGLQRRWSRGTRR